MARKSGRKESNTSGAKRQVNHKVIAREDAEQRTGRHVPARVLRMAALLTTGIVIGFAMGARVQGSLSPLGGSLGDVVQRIEKWSQNLFSPTRSSKEVHTVPGQPSLESNREAESDASTDSIREEYTYPDEISYGQSYDTSTDQSAAGKEASGLSNVGESAYTEDADYASAGRYIDVDLGTQYAVLYDGAGNVLWESPIVSGDVTTGFGTPEGTYTIYDKELSTELIGLDYDGDGYPDYDNYVDYWMPFSGGLGLHDASWRENFGENIYSYDGSHGCVNLPYDAAASLYDLVTVGETVVVHW